MKKLAKKAEKRTKDAKINKLSSQIENTSIRKKEEAD